MNEIWFYSEKEKPYGVFSNFYQCNIDIGGVVYLNSESYFQAEKFRGESANKDCIDYAELIRRQSTAGKSAILARQRKPSQPYKCAKDLYEHIKTSLAQGISIRKDWNSIRDNIMRRIVYQKFYQNQSLFKILKDTDDAQLVEHTHRDNYWADGHPIENPNIRGDGANMLGKILEETRYILGGKPSPRYSNMLLFPFSNWIIPGMFLASGGFDRKTYLRFRDVGFKYFVSLMPHHQEQTLGKSFQYRTKDFEEDNFCAVEDGVIVARWAIEDRKTISDEKTIQIALTIIKAIGLGYPTVLHCFGGKGRTGVIACIVIGLIYGIDGKQSIEICERLFLEHRPNKGKKILKHNMPQTKKQIDQVKRILSKDINNRGYKNFY